MKFIIWLGIIVFIGIGANYLHRQRKQWLQPFKPGSVVMLYSPIYSSIGLFAFLMAALVTKICFDAAENQNGIFTTADYLSALGLYLFQIYLVACYERHVLHDTLHTWLPTSLNLTTKISSYTT